MKAFQSTPSRAVILLLFTCYFSACNQIIEPVSKKQSEIVIETGLPQDLSQSATEEEAAQFAWNTFMAINQPDQNGQGTQWENYKEAFDIFLDNAATPTPWGEPTPATAPPCEAFLQGQKVLRVTSKVSPIINETDQAVGGVLIDRNQNLVHYEVYMNKPMFNYVLENQYYNAVTQAGNNINFPNGSMELKSAWRILDPAIDDTSRYHTANAIIYLPNAEKIENDSCLPPSVKNRLEVCSQQLVGLVGLHIAYKTPSNPSFTWITFEQVDNVKSNKYKGKTIPASFRNNDKSVLGCPENSRQCNCPEQETSQITRQNPISEWVQNVNKKNRDTLQTNGSVWANYELVGIQYARDSSLLGNPVLVNLANTSMETFNQTASSCVGCHAVARSSNPARSSDFSWVMGRAQNPTLKLPEANGKSLLTYVMRQNPYSEWKSWPNSIWNIYSKATAGENPHGKSIRIYVNDIALEYFKKIENNVPENPILPEGSIVLKENFRTKPTETPVPSDLVELTAMYKAKDKDGKEKWFWLKARPYGSIYTAGFNNESCTSCHDNWKGNGDSMLSFNFGKRPVVTEVPYVITGEKQAYSTKEIHQLKDYLVSLE